MKPDEPRKELKPEELLTAMIGKTIRTVNFTAIDLLAIEFTDGTEVELKSNIIDFGGYGDPSISGFSPVYMNSRDIANMLMEKDLQSLEGIVMKPETQFHIIRNKYSLNTPKNLNNTPKELSFIPLITEKTY